MYLFTGIINWESELHSHGFIAIITFDSTTALLLLLLLLTFFQEKPASSLFFLLCNCKSLGFEGNYQDTKNSTILYSENAMLLSWCSRRKQCPRGPPTLTLLTEAKPLRSGENQVITQNCMSSAYFPENIEFQLHSPIGNTSLLIIARALHCSTVEHG